MMHPRKLLLLVLPLAAMLPALAAAAMRPVLKERPGMPPYDVLGEIFAANGHRPSPPAARVGEPPDFTWLADCDAAVRRSLIASPGQRLLTVRTLGFQLASGVAAVDYGIRHLHTPVLLITGNTGNEAIRMLMGGCRQVE
nr:hypothetical protein [Desulfobacteraceae bacterium]